MKIAFLGNFAVDFSSESHHAKSLEQLGHKVFRIQENRPINDTPDCDLFIWVHTHGWKSAGIEKLINKYKGHVPIVSYHLDLWFGLERQKDLDTDPFYKLIDHWFVTDKLMADWLNKETKVKGYYLPPGVYGEECYIADEKIENDVIFVGSRGYHPEWSYRPKLIDWLKETYGDRFKHYGGDGLGVVRGDELNKLYASTKAVVGDSTCINFNYPYYWSDRVPETLGRGGFLIQPYVEGMEDWYRDGEHLVNYEYNDFDQLKKLIDYYLENDSEREHIRRAGHELVKARDTYKHRWEHILDEVFDSKN